MKMNKLKEYFLKDLYEISSGISTKPEQAGYGYPFISFRTIFNNWILPSELNDLMNTSKIEREKYSIKKGDILLTRTSEKIDELAMSSVALKDYENTTFSGFAKRLRPIQTDITYDKFMAFFLRSPYFREIIDKKTTMTLRASFNETLFSQIKILLPEYKTQVKIGELLCKMEEKIKLNNKINSELENMAKTIYDYWFLQFEFPNDEGKPYKSSGGKMVWNEELKKEIPEGWEVTELDKILKRNKIAILDYKQYYDTIDLSVMPSESINLNKINSSFNFTTNLYELKEGDILFGSIRPYLKKCGISSYNGSFAGTVYSYTPYKYFDFNFCISLMSSNNFFDYAIKVSKGTKMPIVSSEDLMKYKVPYSKEISLKFNNFLNFKNLFIRNNQESQELTSLRDYLLPLLMNGQVGFKD